MKPCSWVEAPIVYRIVPCECCRLVHLWWVCWRNNYFQHYAFLFLPRHAIRAYNSATAFYLYVSRSHPQLWRKYIKAMQSQQIILIRLLAFLGLMRWTAVMLPVCSFWKPDKQKGFLAVWSYFAVFACFSHCYWSICRSRCPADPESCTVMLPITVQGADFNIKALTAWDQHGLTLYMFPQSPWEQEIPLTSIQKLLRHPLDSQTRFGCMMVPTLGNNFPDGGA